jgi:hypothetical protein
VLRNMNIAKSIIELAPRRGFTLPPLSTCN